MPASLSPSLTFIPACYLCSFTEHLQRAGCLPCPKLSWVSQVRFILTMHIALLPSSPSPTFHILRTQCFPTHKGIELKIPPLVNSCGLQMKPPVTREGQHYPRSHSKPVLHDLILQSLKLRGRRLLQDPQAGPSGPWKEGK